MTRGARLALVANNFPPVHGGSAVVYHNLARHAGDRIIVVAPRVSYVDGLPIIGWREHDRRASYPVRRLPLLRTKLRRSGRMPLLREALFIWSDVLIRFRLVSLLLHLIATQNVRAICVGELLASGWILQLFRLLPGVRLIVYVHGEEITTEDLYDPGQTRRRNALEAADAIVVVSRFTERAVLALLGEEAEPRVRLIANGVDTARFRCSVGKPADLLRLYDLEGDFVFVSVCRLLEKKGLDYAIRAFARIADEMPDTRYLIVGTGPFEAALRQIAKQTGVADRVIFAGQVPDDDLVAHYCLGDVFIMPNRELPNGDTEGFGLVFLEANSCGMPVIAGRDGGSIDAVQDGVNGLVVDGQSIDAVAEAMRRLRADPDLRSRLGRQSMEYAAAASWDAKTAAFLALCFGSGSG